MDEQTRQEIANFNYSLIAPIVCRKNLSHGEEYELLRQIAKGQYDIPHSTRRTVSLRSLERYLSLYREGGLEALKPSQRERTSRIPVEYLQQAALLKRENPRRSILTIISMLEKSGRVPEGILKRSTLYDYFVKENLAGKCYSRPKEHYRRFSASYRGEILQGDIHHTLYMPDPSRPGQKRKVFLFAWLDDYSRLAFGEFYWAEKLPALENTLKKWIIKYGTPENIYCDNGAVYSSHYLQTICGSLGIRLLHSRPYKPQGRGKCEKLFQLVESSFKSEAMLLINEGKIKTLEELNRYLFVWIDKFYNERVHSATKQKPILRWQADKNELRKPSLNEIYEAFLLQKDGVKVSKVGIIRLESNEYEVESVLSGKEITVRYDPYDLSKGVRIYFEGKRYEDAIPAKIRRHHHKKFVDDITEHVPYSGINHLEQLKEEAKTDMRGISFASLSGKDENTL